ncbi:fibronectin type III domain-containing protein, partial [Candidatus Woesearchaeota archaeon]|nr:fibronectin type III domain-containing protein [Candidatus Woesearchaeota archaeon]
SNVTASVADVIYYNVYRSTNVSFELSSATRVKNVSMNFNKTTDFPGVNAKYYYKVTAVDNALLESAASNEVSTTVTTAVGAVFGTLAANQTIVRNGSSVLFTFTGNRIGFNVSINQSEMRNLDNTSGALLLNDSGVNSDFLMGDATYSAAYTLSMLNNESDGLKQLIAEVNDSAGNYFRPRVNITLDNTKPNVSIVINDNVALSIYRLVKLTVNANDSVAMDSCRFANEDRVFGDWEACVTNKVWQLTTSSGNKTAVVQARDKVGNVQESNDTIEVKLPIPLGPLTVSPAVVKNGDNLTFFYDSASAGLTALINLTELQKLDNTSTQALVMHDDGVGIDSVASDGIYAANYTIGVNNNASDGVKKLTATVNDSEGNYFRPAVNITLDNTRPNATISIFGLSPAGFTNVSTEYTFSRAVTLVAAFNDTSGGTATTVSGGVSSCRFANENQQFTDWEGCTTAKAWLLSDGNGNKTAIVEVRDLAGNVNRTNDTIFLNTSGVGLDITPPGIPTVVDGGTYTNIDSSLHARWNSTDHESELLHIPLEWEYRIVFDNFTRRLNETWQYAGIAAEVTVYSLNLSNGTNYTFEVRAINTAGLRSANGTSDGIIVDISLPDAPSVSSTHSQSAWSSNSAVSFNWSANDTLSGVGLYSYVLDTNATTIPDNVPEAENDHATLASSSNDGKSTMLKFNSTGNASAVFVEVKGNLSANDVVRVTVQLAEASTGSPDAMGFRVYVITAVPTSFAMNGSNISLIVDTSNDISFVSSILDATSYTVEVPMTTSVTGSRFFVAVAGETDDDNNRHNLLLAVSNSSIDSSTQSYQCGEVLGVCSNTTNTSEYGIKVDVRDLKQDGIWDRAYAVGDGRMYFHVKAKDKAGNFGATTNYSLLVDTSPPSTPQMTEPSKYTNTTSVAFNWTQSMDADSGVDNYSLQADNNSDFSSPEFYAWVGNTTNYTVTGLTADATYNARVHSRNLAGVNSSLSSSVSTVIDTTAPSITFSKPSSSGVLASQDVVLALNTNEKAICAFSLNSATYLNFTYTNSTYHETKVSASTGSNTVLVKCHDAILNENTPASTTFEVSTTSTASTITLQSPTVFTGDVVRTDVIVTTSSSQRLGELGAAAFTVKINGGAIPASVFDNGAGNYTLVFDSPATNGTYTMGVDVGSATATTTLSVRALLFTVQYVQSGISSSSGDRLIYFVTGNFSLGLATDSRSFDKSSTSSALNMTSDARAGTAYIFVTRQSGGVERVESLLKERKFLDSVNPSFGYAIDQDTFVVFTDLEYDDIALSGNKTLTTGRYNLIIENKGFDATLNKTKLEVRVQ